MEEDTVDKEAKNLTKVRRRGYIMTGEVKSLTNYFSVSKGEDIQMVYNGTSSGLDAASRVPHFALPEVRSKIREVDNEHLNGILVHQENVLKFYV